MNSAFLEYAITAYCKPENEAVRNQLALLIVEYSSSLSSVDNGEPEFEPPAHETEQEEHLNAENVISLCAYRAERECSGG